MNQLSYKPEDVVVAVDIGTTKICVVAGVPDEYGKWTIIGSWQEPCDGVRRGVVSNIEKTVSAITAAVERVERQILAKITNVHVGIAGQHIKSQKHHGILTRDNAMEEITQADIDKLKQDMHKISLPPGDKILDVIPQEYTIDNESGILEPIGMSGSRLEAKFHLITAQVGAINNIKRCIQKAGLTIADIRLEPIASAASVLSEEEKEAGVAIVDIGGGTTDVTIFHDGIIRHTAIIPLGGDIVTKDIKDGCTILKDQAERLKVKFGSALSTEVKKNLIITVPGLKGREEKEISIKNLSLIIQARLEEIFDFVKWEIERSGYASKLIGGVVLTGGGAIMKNIQYLMDYHTGYHTRVGFPVDHLSNGYKEELSSPSYATAIGLVICGHKNRTYESAIAIERDPNEVALEIEGIDSDHTEEMVATATETVSTAKPKTGGIKSLFDKAFEGVKDWIEASPDYDHID